MSQEARLIEKLRRIEALFARPGTEGERDAAERARERILARLREVEREDPAVEFKFSLADQWSRRLFIALLRRYGITPYRIRGQRRTTIMARISKRFVDETLWPEFQALQATLQDYSTNSRHASSARPSTETRAMRRNGSPGISESSKG